MSPQRVEAFRLKRDDEIEKMRASGKILGACLSHLAAQVRPGITTLDLDRVADTFIRDHGCVPGFLGYNGFPNSLCVSVNDEVVHGIPGPRVIEEGDLVSLDCGLILDGWWADSGLSLACGQAGAEVCRLIDVTREALDRGIAAAQPGNHIGDIGHAVQSFVEEQGFSVVRNYVGHGIGRNMHEPPQVPNYGAAGTGNLLKPGYVLAIEPMVNAGGADVELL
ncbi:MAG TPA: type I methionyl aminopeptidase, partial [Candidatus Dormibacteraeota bacterium]|nr:type I methionyl aminopeptidase [Candidatus Dormibacteraeota bacterium]